MKADIVVIGAGALGLSTALHCAMAGRSVLVVERATAGSQASGRAAGLFKSVQADELRTVLARRSIVRAIRFADWCPEDSYIEEPINLVRTSLVRAYLVRAYLAAGIVRIADAAVCLRPARGGLMLGGFEPAPLPLDPRSEPPSFSTDDVPLDQGTIGKLADQVAGQVPLASHAPIAELRGGLLTMSPDGQFVVGPVPDLPGLWVAIGCNGSGLSSSPAADGVWQYAHFYGGVDES